MRLHHLAATLVLITASFAVACLIGARDQTTDTPPTGADDRFCPPRWAADNDPLAPAATEARQMLETDLPEGARPLLPSRALRLAEGCPLQLPLSVRGGQCYLFGLQVTPPEGLRPWAILRIPDRELDQPLEHVVDHPMATTLGEGADPICYDESFNSIIEVLADNPSSLVWVQAYEVSRESAELWTSQRRTQLSEAAQEARAAAMAAAMAAAQEREAAQERCQRHTSANDGGIPDGGIPDGGITDASIVEESDEADLCPEASTGDAGLTDAGLTDAGSGGEPISGWPDGSLGGHDNESVEPISGWPDGSLGGHDQQEATAPEPTPEPEPAPEPAPETTPAISALPLGPIAVELEEQCGDGEDNDSDNALDCDDPDCRRVCSRNERTPWPRVIDVRLGGGYRVGARDVVAEEPLDSEYDPLTMQWAFTTQASGIWRVNRYLGVGLDLGIGASELRSFLLGDGRGAQNKVSVLSVSLGAALHLSVPVWIMEIGGSVGLGWLHLGTSGQERSLSGDDTSWQENSGADQGFNHPYGSGQLWIDFWLRDSIALGLYGGLLAPMTRRPQLVANEYYVGLRTTLRLGF